MDFSKRILFLITCAYIMLLPLIPQDIVIARVPFTDLVFALLITVYIINLVMYKKNRENFINGIIDSCRDKLNIFMAILLAIMLASTIYAVDKKLALSETARYISYVFMYFVIKYEFNNKEQIKILIRCYIFISTVVCSIGIVQYFTRIGLDDKYIKSFSIGRNIKMASTLSHPNAYAGYLILIIFPVIMLSIYEKNKNKRIFYTLLSVLVFTNILMTYSRNAILGFTLGLVVLAIIYSIKIIFALGGFGVLILLIPSVFQRVQAISNSSQNESRIKLWKTALMMIKEHPILGVGNGNYVTQYDTYIHKYRLDYNSYSHYPAHNSYLKVESELGIIGIVSFLGVIVTALLRFRKLYSTTDDKFYKAFYMGVTASMIAFLFMNFSDNLFFVPKTTTYFWFLLATAEALLNSGNSVG